MKDLTIPKQIYAFLLCALIFTSCTNEDRVGDALITSYQKESEIHIVVRWPQHYDRNKVKVKIFNQLKNITYNNEDAVRLFIENEKKDSYGKFYFEDLEYVKSFSAAEAKKYATSADWSNYNSIYR